MKTSGKSFGGALIIGTLLIVGQGCTSPSTDGRRQSNPRPRTVDPQPRANYSPIGIVKAAPTPPNGGFARKRALLAGPKAKVRAGMTVDPSSTLVNSGEDFTLSFTSGVAITDADIRAYIVNTVYDGPNDKWKLTMGAQITSTYLHSGTGYFTGRTYANLSTTPTTLLLRVKPEFVSGGNQQFIVIAGKASGGATQNAGGVLVTVAQ